MTELNELDQELNTLEAMFDLLSSNESKLFRDQLSRIKLVLYKSAEELVRQYKTQQAIIADAIADVMLDVAATQHDLESTQRERDDLMGT